MPRPIDHPRIAFTLVEMLVVIGVIGVLMGLILPAIAGIRAESKSTQCLSNLRQSFVALDTWRQQNKDLFPYAAPLPPPPDQTTIIPGLPERLQAIIPRDSESWLCPADDSDDAQEIGTSYMYIVGGWMLVEPLLIPVPPDPPLSMQAQVDRVRRIITQRYTGGFLRNLPLITDIEENHTSGDRNPRNAVFLDGNARIMKPNDGVVSKPTE